MIAIIDYGLGNLTSIKNMCNRLGVDAFITSNEQEIISADKLILPGVGHFNKGMENLKQSGLQVLLNDLVLQKKKPILGICLGAQLMTMHSEEANIDGLRWVDANTIKFDSSKMDGLKIPHMGWADIDVKNENALLKDLPIEPRFYHVHAYHFAFNDVSLVSATAKYGYDFATAFQKNNIYGTQFHPEKSHKFGMKILENFSTLGYE
jgi:imidazole glycerol-phosphate synthase subunit HisH